MLLLLRTNIEIKDNNRAWYNSEIFLLKRNVRKADKKFKIDQYREELRLLRSLGISVKGIVMLDLSAAFNTVDHVLLLHDFQIIGLRGLVYK